MMDPVVIWVLTPALILGILIGGILGGVNAESRQEAIAKSRLSAAAPNPPSAEEANRKKLAYDFATAPTVDLSGKWERLGNEVDYANQMAAMQEIRQIKGVDKYPLPQKIRVVDLPVKRISG